MVEADTYGSTHSPRGCGYADIVLTGGQVFTVDRGNPWAEAVAWRGERLVLVGSKDEVARLIGPHTRVYDLNGRFVMPGLHDMHTHPDLALAGRYADDLNVGLGEPTPEQLARAIREYADQHPGRGWIYGQHWVHYTFREAGERPGKAWLDRITSDRPVAILDRMWGTMMVNSLALERAGINASTPDPRNGYFERDDVTGEPTGLLIDGAYALIHAVMPPADIDALRQAYRDGVRFQTSRGVTASKYVHVCERRLEALKELDQRGELTLRVEAAISWQDDIFPVRRRWQLLAGEHHYYRSRRLNANAVKFHFDGTAEARSSFLLAPWPGEKRWRGKVNLTPEHITDMVVDMDRRGFRVIAHCTGDGASDLFLDAVAEARKRNGDSGVRHQCAHCTILHPGNLERFRELNVIAEFSPAAWYPSQFASQARATYGKERLRSIYNIRGVLDAGGTAVMGTDWPVASCDPWVGLETLVTRRNPWVDSEAQLGDPISLEAAIRVCTINGARAMGLETETGSLIAGKRADLIVLAGSPFAEDPQGYLHRMVVDLTFVDGELVYDRSGELSDYCHAVWQGDIAEP